MSSQKRGSDWSYNEDVFLCNSWVSISEDGAVGINQAGDSFWSRVHIVGVNICIWTEIASDAVTLRRRCHLLQFIANISSSHGSELVIDSGLPSHRQPESRESGTIEQGYKKKMKIRRIRRRKRRRGGRKERRVPGREKSR
ncbi:unnamed protein product [Cuscuta europaea]|uniref:Uncharacterized protein n=1 Tax=Cuscuta europaea TaxID=41803 RepID=A0A9P0ZGG5_CUSEU|nr:unnamed protein product [Cuscuta europaea]